MRLKLQTPNEVLIDLQVTKVTAEAVNGSFCLLPKHIDIAAALVPGLFYYETEQGEETLALDSGVLVKCDDEVLVSTRRAVRGAGLEELHETVRTVFRSLDEKEKKSRSAMARLEAAFVTELVGAQEPA